jgi:hypothetical protein
MMLELLDHNPATRVPYDVEGAYGFHTPPLTHIDLDAMVNLFALIAATHRTVVNARVSLTEWQASTPWMSPSLQRDLPRSPADVDALPAMSSDEIEAHRGEWVILHGGHVVAHAHAPDALFADGRSAQPEYTLRWVPDTRRRFR